MAYSSSDFQGDIINHMLELEMLPEEWVEKMEPELLAEQTKLAITTAQAAHQRAQQALKFFDELVDATDSFSAVAEKHGVQALADIIYMQAAIVRGTCIELNAAQGGTLEFISGLPSCGEWFRRIDTITV